MNLGMVGLGRMGANMTERLREHGHTVETYARTNPERTANSLVQLAGMLPQPRVVWLMIPAGDPTENAFQTILGLLEDGDIIVDGGNSNFRDSQRRAAEADLLDAKDWFRQNCPDLQQEFAASVRDTLRHFRHSFGRAVVLGLELLVAADILRTLATTPTLGPG